MKRIDIFLITLLFSCPIFAQSGWKPDPKVLEAPIYFLASPLLEGRDTGERGSLVAAEYIASEMMQIGLLPAGDVRSGKADWFQDFQKLPNSADSTKSWTVQPIIRNVLGMIKGIDTTKYVVIGGHYDHLGMHGDSIFTGADDNASGTSGMLALARHWNSLEKRPPVNLIFAAWTSEERGHQGSKYYASHFATGQENIKLVVNFDMISRSAPEDTACNMLSIGVVKEDTLIRELSVRNNAALGINLELDLWITDGEGGSDYAPFAAYGVPVMTFHTGWDEDYHTPGDTRDKIDLSKMAKVLQLANSCLEGFLGVE
jgi:hypothetical protein